MTRQERIDACITECTECGSSREFPERSDCDSCAAVIDYEIAAEAQSEGERIAAITRSIAQSSV